LEEVRLGLVLYGGVSLAIYINGVVQELFSMVRATAPELDGTGSQTGRLLIPDDELSPVERCYRSLAGLRLDPTADNGDGEYVPDDRVRRRFVVDIISGSSAGGINGVFLAKALANTADGIQSLKDLWVRKGDFANLLNDPQTRRSRRGRIEKTEASDALLSGDVMYMELLDALDAMDDELDLPARGPDDADASPYVEELDLWVTATDLEGLVLPIQLADQSITERRHRHVFHFVFGEAQTETRRRNDFVQNQNQMLAFAARATSSFPFAFRPVQLADVDRVRRGRGVPRNSGKGANDERWKAWFPDHVADSPDFNYTEISFGDGGDIDNKPFGWVIDTLPDRTSRMPVDRWLLYVEPDPASPNRSDNPAPRPDVLGSVASAATLGRVEGIRDDIERLAERSSVRDRIRGAARVAEWHLDQWSEEPAPIRTGKAPVAGETAADRHQEWMAETPEEMAKRGISYASYFRLRIDEGIREFARSMVGLSWHDRDTPASKAAELLVQRLVDDRYCDSLVDDPAEENRPADKQFLVSFDVAYRIRRLVFLAARADRLLRASDEEILRVSPDATGEQIAEFRAEARSIKSAIGAIETELRKFIPSVRSNPDPSARIALRPTPREAEFALRSPSGLERIWQRHREDLCAYADNMEQVLSKQFEVARAAMEEALRIDPGMSRPREAARESIRRDHHRFGEYDQVMFPLQVTSGVTGEVDTVQVARVSPRDASALVSTADKVAGSKWGHFGAFFDEGWRRNDIMWGRLDTAERLVTLFGTTTGRKDDIRGEAVDIIADLHHAILADEGAIPARVVDDNVSTPHARAQRDADLKAFSDGFRLPPMPEPRKLLEVASRSGSVASAIAQTVSGGDKVTLVQRIAAAFTWVLSGVLAFVRFREAIKTPLRSLGLACAVVGALLIFVSPLVGWNPGTSSGWLAVGIGAALLIVSTVRLITGGRVRLMAMVLGVLVVTGLAVYGGVALWSDLNL
jgi:patatin-related protein